MRITHGFLGALTCIVVVGCSSPNVNPAAPRANTGYVDFYTDSDLGLSWKVQRGTEPGGEMRPVFSEFKPIEGNILRLAVPPGDQRFEVWFNNQVTTGPQTVAAKIASAKVTPVHVTLSPAGSASVVNNSYEYRPTVHGSRRVTRVATEDQKVFQISASAETPQDYKPKEQMPYFHPGPK